MQWRELAFTVNKPGDRKGTFDLAVLVSDDMSAQNIQDFFSTLMARVEEHTGAAAV